MLRITNLTDKTINITPSACIEPRSYLDVQQDITPKLNQLINMGLIKVNKIYEKQTTNSNEYISIGALRRKQTLNKIQKGDIKQATPLDISSHVYTAKSTMKHKNKSK